MSALESILNNFISLQAETEMITKKIINDAFKANQELLFDENREQLIKGLRSDGTLIKPGYSAIYSNMKKGGRTFPVDLKLTGEYHASFFLEFDNDGIILRGERFEKGFNVREWLVKRYGEKIEGVSDEFLIEFCNIFIIPELQERFKNFLLNER